MAAPVRTMTPELAFRLIEGTLKLDAEYHRLLAEVVEVKDEKLDKIEDLGLDPRKNITATHPKIPADLREWLIKQDKAYRLKALVDKSRKFAADNAERVRAEKTRRASETDDASCRDDDEMRGQDVLMDESTKDATALPTDSNSWGETGGWKCKSC